jgi:hypothetical protein
MKKILQITLSTMLLLAITAVVKAQHAVPRDPDATILPVNFISVNATIAGNTVNVTWQVSKEVNTDLYIIERSDNGVQFNQIGSVAASGNSQYQWLDATVVSGTFFYRIIAVDHDGKKTYSSIVKVSTNSRLQELTINPNPVINGKLVVQMNGFAQGDYTIVIYSVTGQSIFSQKIHNTGNSMAQYVQLPSTIQKGIYELQLIGSVSKVSKTLLIQ